MDLDEALGRLASEPDLHAKRELGRQALEDAEARDAVDDRARVLHELRVSHRPPPALSLYETDAIPARDPYVEVRAGAPPSALNDALIVAEVAATTACEVEEWPTKRALISLAAAKLAETAAIEATLERPWGTDPVDTGGYARALALPLADRLEQLLGDGARSDEDPGL